MKTVLVAGGSGLVGSHLCKKLSKKGYKVVILSRSKDTKSDYKVYTWDLRSKEIEKEAITSADYIINLAGAGVADKRWSEKRKQAIVASRVESTRVLFEAVKKYNKKLEAYISASAAGYYGMKTSENIFKESDPPGDDFLADVCKKWESAADKFKDLNIRTVKIRTAVVFSKDGGALAQLARPAKFGLAAPLGNGKQYMPWIHIEDLCDIYIHALENDKMQGPYNAAAPENITNKELMRKVAKVLHRPFWPIPVPGFLLKIALGQMANSILKGSRVSSEKIQKSGFKFKHCKIETVLQHLL